VKKLKKLTTDETLTFRKIGVATPLFARAIGHSVEVCDVAQVIDEELLLPLVCFARNKSAEGVDDAFVMVWREPWVFLRAP
jgi:hypothetical protein